MFTIDLLKGRGVPVRTRPQGVAIFVATFAVPALAAILLAGWYFRNKVAIAVAGQNIACSENQTKKLADALNLKQACEKDKASINACMADVSNLLKGHFQWTPVLIELVKNLPDSVVLTNLEVKRAVVKRKQAKGQPANSADAAVSVRTLKMRVAANPGPTNDLDVRSFRDRLRASDVLGPKLDDVVVASQGHDSLDGKDVVCYDIDCVFKPGL